MNGLDLFLIIPCLFTLIAGYRQGIIVGTFNFLAIVGGLLIATLFSAQIGDLILSRFHLPSIFNKLSYFLLYLLIYLYIRYLGRQIKLGVKIFGLNSIDSLIGAIAGFLKAFMPISLIIFFLGKFNIIGNETLSKSSTYQLVKYFWQEMFDYIQSLFPSIKQFYLNEFNK